MDVSMRDEDGVRIVVVAHDRLDAAGVLAFKDRFRDAVAGAEGRVILDMSAVNFLDSSGLGAIVSVRKMLGDVAILELASLTPAVERVFRLTRMDSIFTIHGTAG